MKNKLLRVVLIFLIFCISSASSVSVEATTPSPSSVSFMCYSISKEKIEYGEDIEVSVYIYKDPPYYKPMRFKLRMYTYDTYNEANKYTHMYKNDYEAVLKEYDVFPEDPYEDVYIDNYLKRALVVNATIPADWFSKNKGQITFLAKFRYIGYFETGTTYTETLYYEKTEDGILLFEELERADDVGDNEEALFDEKIKKILTFTAYSIAAFVPACILCAFVCVRIRKRRDSHCSETASGKGQL